ncbi:MFS transporter [Paenibacillus rhizosphaerae]|uniref:MFS transporter n=1 Tax=Paenibacillus rhizosphaerae TaxID=297318 RepID=UPI001FEBB25E|nr:MFS transporter [Paenibacillus rhizosphaerae]
MILFVVGNGLAIAASGFNMLMAARVLASLTHGSFIGAAAVVASGMVPERKRGWAVSMIVSGSSAANIVGVPFGTFLGQWFGWRSAGASRSSRLGTMLRRGIHDVYVYHPDS